MAFVDKCSPTHSNTVGNKQNKHSTLSLQRVRATQRLESMSAVPQFRDCILRTAQPNAAEEGPRGHALFSHNSQTVTSVK